MKNVFLDTNVLLEILCNRRYCKSCEQILMRGKNGYINLFASFLTFANMAYVLQREKINREDLTSTMIHPSRVRANASPSISGLSFSCWGVL